MKKLDEDVQGLDKTQTPFMFAQNRLASKCSFVKQSNIYLYKARYLMVQCIERNQSLASLLCNLSDILSL